jgi:hypothetical protein
MFNLNIDPTDVDTFVKNALMESTIGVRLKEAIDKEIKDALSGYDSPVKKLVREAVSDRIAEFLKLPQNAEILRAAVSNYISETTLQKILQKTVEAFDSAIARY